MLSFFSVMTKTLKFFTALIALTLASPAWAAGPVILRWVRDVPLDGTEGNIASSVPLQYSDGTLALPGSGVYLLFVVPEEGVTFGTDEVPFSIGVDGSVIPGAGVARTEWGNLSTAASGIYGMPLGDEDLQGYPDTEWPPLVLHNQIVGGTTGSAPYYWPSSAGTMPSCYAYLVLFDTRAVDPATGAVVSVDPEGSYRTLPKRITGWGATQCAYVEVSPLGPGTEIYVGLQGELMDLMALLVEHVAGPVQATKLPTLTEWTEGDTQLSGADLEAALKPTISGMVATTIAGEDGAETPAFAFDFTPAPLPGLSTYTLYTATDLAGPWQPFDKVLKEKELANPSGMRYTTLRIDGEESVPMTIPRLENDPTRFYRLQGDVEVVTTDQEGE